MVTRWPLKAGNSSRILIRLRGVGEVREGGRGERCGEFSV